MSGHRPFSELIKNWSPERLAKAEERFEKENEMYTEEEQKEHVRDLICALRSGDYEQGFSALRNEKGFCCLGVACEISGLGEWKDYYFYLESQEIMPKEVMDYYGFRTGYGSNRENSNSLTFMNDSQQATFEEIAKYIELEEGLFTWGKERIQ